MTIDLTDDEIYAAGVRDGIAAERERTSEIDKAKDEVVEWAKRCQRVLKSPLLADKLAALAAAIERDPTQDAATSAETAPVRRDWCEEHNRGSLAETDGLCPDCEARSAKRAIESAPEARR